MQSNICVAAIYQFTPLDDLNAHKQKLFNLCQGLKIKGTLILGKEGINGTVAGSQRAIDELHNYLITKIELNNLSYKLSYCEDMPFLRLKVKIKSEIVTIGIDAVNPQQTVGEYVSPQTWDELLQDPEVLVIDTRNDYETAIGKFKNAVDPNTKNFREFPEYVKKSLDKNKHKKIAMYCTGGIRCEKASSYMLEQGFEKVYHLKGGILKYLEETPKEKSNWVGDCFVFDERVALNHNLEPSEHKQCFGCRHPLTISEQKDCQTIPGVCCPYCANTTSKTQKARYLERQKQINIAKAKGIEHLGQMIEK